MQRAVYFTTGFRVAQYDRIVTMTFKLLLYSSAYHRYEIRHLRELRRPRQVLEERS
jgi:hypothetical protein